VDAFPGTAELPAIGIRLGTAWWQGDRGAGVTVEADAIEPEAGGDDSFDVTAFEQAGPTALGLARLLNLPGPVESISYPRPRVVDEGPPPQADISAADAVQLVDDLRTRLSSVPTARRVREPLTEFEQAEVVEWQLHEPPRRPASMLAEARTAARTFQGEELTNASTGLVATLGRNALDKILSESAVKKSSSTADHALAVANLDQLFARAILGTSHRDRGGNPNIEAVHRFFAPLRTPTGSRLVKLTVKEYASEGQEPKVYSIEAIDVDTGPASILGDAASSEGGPDFTRTAGPVTRLADAIRAFNACLRDDTLRQGDDRPAPFGSYNPITHTIKLLKGARFELQREDARAGGSDDRSGA
jgi:hypothetical protein